MVTQQQIDKLQREVNKKKMEIKKIESLTELSIQKKRLEKEILRTKDPQAFLRREKTKRILGKIGRLQLRGLKVIGKGAFRGLKATGKHLVEVAQFQAMQDERREGRRSPKKKMTKKKAKSRKRR